MDLGCGITFDIFTHVFTRVVFFFKFIIIYIHKEREKKKHCDNLEDGYNVVKLQRKNKREQHLSSSRYIETGTVYNNIITLHPVEKDNF